jgi:hypothetical protein
LVLAFCKMTNTYVSFRHCIMIDSNCVHRHPKLWHTKEELAQDRERPLHKGALTINRPMACQLSEQTIVHRYTNK